ncbi:hypothetical protein AA13595_1149 [Gluconacetobacter johannae DSM 13595]|uniref:Uncharacterized protein n=1 Tax=Gluconacetobacter johannae TaxID=112140 RepID=A0A7W4P4P4_9PROT|nr:hypothetical protein [Gluconacetobacter johannae]MBB2177252.1 hypothetical protein [Gluconacetobacter johannae]GBQ83320.1 hypothetical protein AA13595_1149 [Gluconacetobacter johannae DSM 13595]
MTEEPDGTIEFATVSSAMIVGDSNGAVESASGSDGSASTVASATSALDPVSAKRTDESNLLDQLFQISDQKHKSGNNGSSNNT